MHTERGEKEDGVIVRLIRWFVVKEMEKVMLDLHVWLFLIIAPISHIARSV